MSGGILGAGGTSLEGRDRLDRARRGAARAFARLAWIRTAGESTSIPGEEARQLLGSMAYVLGVRHLDDPAAIAVLSRDDALDAFEERRAALERRARETAGAWRKVVSTMPQIPNGPLMETLASIAGAPDRHDTYLSAQEVPAELAYQPHGFSGRGLLGIDAASVASQVEVACHRRALP